LTSHLRQNRQNPPPRNESRYVTQQNNFYFRFEM
jgi:hypothetical protein